MKFLFAAALILCAACTPMVVEQQAFNEISFVAQETTLLIATNTLPPTDTPTRTPIITRSRLATATPTRTPIITRSRLASATPTLSPVPTQPLYTLTPVSSDGAPAAYVNPPAGESVRDGWSCGDFPCADDLTGWGLRLRVPGGYRVEHVGRYPGQPIQIIYGRDGRLYATVLEDGSRSGSIYVMGSGGGVSRYSPAFISPMGLAFQPGTDILYVSARLNPQSGGALFRVLSSGVVETVFDDLPCCLSLIDNQPNGITFGRDGYLYMGVGSLSDHGEAPEGSREQLRGGFATFQPYEAAILRIQPHTGEIEVIAQGIRNPVDVAFDANDDLYATDNGVFTGEGDRLLRVERGAHHGFPYWKARGCEECPLAPGTLDRVPELVTFPTLTLPRGLTIYTGTQFPVNMFGSVFVTLWNEVEGGQRVVRIDPRRVPPEAGEAFDLQVTLSPYDPTREAPVYALESFLTGLIRPTDVVVAPDGSLVVADYVYGNVWRVVYEGS